MSATDENDDELHWRGCSMEEIYRNLNPFELKHINNVYPSESHTVLYHFPVRDTRVPPKPFKGHNKWDAFHVRMPCSPRSQYPVIKDDDSVSIENRWDMIKQALQKPIKNSKELQAAILSYNSKYEFSWTFHALHKLFDDELDEDTAEHFFSDLLPKIVNLALRLPELIQTAIPLLKQGQSRSVTLSQQQIACLMANAFLCTFPRRNTMKKKSEYSTFPDINFNRLFQSSASNHHVLEKIKCICHYFKRVCNADATGVVTFSRRSISSSELPNWSESHAPLGVTPLHITSCGTIEDDGKGLLEVDFANKFLGGGVLGSGCVQEEIRFVICPELIISKLFTEALRPNEALLMIGSEQFSKYSGYASTFTWDGNFEDPTPFDESHRRQCSIVAIDALYFMESLHQYREELMLRELNKAYVGFYHPLETPAPGVASGNWGCGAFGGDATLKALIQLMACTVTKRPLVYFTFGNCELRDAIHKIHTFFIENNVKVKDLWSYLKNFRDEKLAPKELYDYIYRCHHNKNKITTCSVKQSKTTSSERNISKMGPLPTVDVSKKMISLPLEKQTKAICSTITSLPKCKQETTKSSTRGSNVSQDMFASSSSEEEELVIPETQPFPTTSQANAKKPTELRQRSLLEMLDKCYTGNPAKRHCVTSPASTSANQSK